ncbi:MAG TPA: GNAT family N-acetyltransferase [Caulobacter sp.]|nr:GNAT family N-acetyltransferase [Caulobacter sp.]
MEISIVRCAPADAARLSAVARATFLETYSGIVAGGDILLFGETTHAPHAYEQLLADVGVDLFLATVEPGRAPVGYAMVCKPDLPVPLEEGDLELKRIYCLHRFHGVGLGPRLMAAAMEAARARGAKRLLLGAYGENHRAIAFYGKHGFRQVGTRVFHVGENFYDDVVLAAYL